MPSSRPYLVYPPSSPVRTRSHVSYGPPHLAYLSRSSPVILVEAEPVQLLRASESDDEYCRRKDRHYSMLADELAAEKKQRDQMKELMDSAREYEQFRKSKKDHSELKDKVKLLEKRVEDAKRDVLRRNRL